MLGMLVLLAVQAAPAPTPAVVPPAAAAAPADKKVCRTEVDTGSIMGRRTCHTRAEWSAISEANARERERQRGSSGRPGSSGLNGGG